MEAEAAREDQAVMGEECNGQRLAFDPLVLAPVERETDRPSSGRPDPSRGHSQRMWNVGELSMQTRFDSR